MIYIAIGVPLLVLFMVAVMGIPFLYYLKRDQEYMAAEQERPTEDPKLVVCFQFNQNSKRSA